MPRSWSALHGALLRSTLTSGFHRGFATLRGRHPALARFRTPEDLLGALQGRDGDPEAKNAVLAALVCEHACDTAATLVLLALWPGLDAVRGRLLRFFRHDPDALTGELPGRLTDGVARLDRTRVTRIAATLLRNLERDIRRDLARQWKLEKVSAEKIDVPPAPADPDTAMDARAVHDVLTGDLSPLTLRLLHLVEVEGYSRAEAARALGLSEAAARKRHQRAMAQLREGRFRFSEGAMSRSGARSGVSPADAMIGRQP